MIVIKMFFSSTGFNHLALPKSAINILKKPHFFDVSKESAEVSGTHLSSQHAKQLDNFRLVVCNSSLSLDQLFKQVQDFLPPHCFLLLRWLRSACHGTLRVQARIRAEL